MHSYDPSSRQLAYGLAALAGFVDATGYLAADRYFVSFMSGNTTRLGVDLVTDMPRAFIPALLLLGFVCGVTVGALVADRAIHRPRTAVIALATLLLCCAAIGRLFGQPALFLAFSVPAMGVINNSFRREGEVAVGLTYMTGALVRLGQGLARWMSGSAQSGWSTHLLLWASLSGGAILGALAASRNAQLSAWMAVAVSVAAMAASFRIERPDQSRVS